MSDTGNNRRSNISIGLIILAFFGIALNTLFFLPAISSATQMFYVQSQGELFFPTEPLLLVGYIVVPIIYCSFASILLHPKTMVNPLVIQIGAFALVIIFTLMNLSNGRVIATTQLVLTLGVLIAFSMAFVILIGFFQGLIVVLVIRMTYEDVDRISYLVDMKPKEFLHKLGDSFLIDYNFTRECDTSEFWVLERSDNNRHLLLEIGTNPKDENRSILATISYEVVDNVIIKSDSANRLRESILDNIEKRLSINFQKNITALDDPVSKLALINVENYTRSRIEVTWTFLRKLPRLFKLMLGLTLALLVGLTVIYFNFNQQKIISTDTFVGAFVVLMVALFIEIGIPLREELQKKKREEIEF